jgi:hypothetical protein
VGEINFWGFWMGFKWWNRHFVKVMVTVNESKVFWELYKDLHFQFWRSLVCLKNNSVIRVGLCSTREERNTKKNDSRFYFIPRLCVLTSKGTVHKGRHLYGEVWLPPPPLSCFVFTFPIQITFYLTFFFIPI